MVKKHGSVEFARRRVELFARDVDAESWKLDHEKAMRCLNFEEFLKNGIGTFDFIVRLDESFREQAMRARERGEVAENEVIALQATLDLMKAWLLPCEGAEQALKHFEASEFDVIGAEEFRKRREEATWMVADAKDAFAHEKIVAERDEAVDFLRQQDD